MAGQWSTKYATAIGTQLLAKIHILLSKVDWLDCRQNHPIDHLDEHIDFVGEATDCVGKVVDELNHIDAQDVQIDQLANIVNNLIGKAESQAKEIQDLKTGREEHCKVIIRFTAKLIALEECVEDVQKKAFPKVRVEFEHSFHLLILLSSRLWLNSWVNRLLLEPLSGWHSLCLH